MADEHGECLENGGAHTATDVLTSVSAERFDLVVNGVADYAIFLLDTKGNVTTWNAGAERIKGYKADEIIGQHFSRFYTPEALATKWPEKELEMALLQGRFEDEGWRVRKDGGTFWANVVITPIRDRDGNSQGFLKITRDLTERRIHEEVLRQSEERFRLLVGGVKDYAIFMLDTDGRVTSWNEGARRINGYEADEIIGQHFSRFYPADALAKNWPSYELEMAKRNGRFEDEGWRIRKDGSRFWANVIITPLYGPDGVQRGFAKVTRDLAERRRVESLEEANRRMNEFLAMVSHELRTPLNAMLGWIRLLRSGHLEPATVARGLATIERNTLAQAQLIEDLLDVSRIVSGKLRLTVEPVDLEPPIRTAIDSVRLAADAKQLRLRTMLDSTVGPVLGDAIRLQQVIWNLLSNAIKFTPDGGEVRIELARADSGVEITVSDTGIGIAPEFIPHVFDRFRQADASTSRKHGGLGLGLAIVKHLVEAHGGTVRANSAGVGAGASFVVRLPTAQVNAASATTTESVGIDTVLGAFEYRPSLQGIRVLAVDDEPDTRDMLALVLGECEADVRTAASAAEALAMLDEWEADVLVSDIGMPIEDGYELIRRVRARPKARGGDVPAVALTAYARFEDRMLALKAGFQMHVPKPIEPNELVTVVNSLLQFRAKMPVPGQSASSET
jgi:PAS domain S-box-containing protein